MSFLKSLPHDSSPGTIFEKYPKIYGYWAEMGQEIMNGDSVFSPGERELIAAYAAHCAGSEYAFIAHSAAAKEWGINPSALPNSIRNFKINSIKSNWHPILALVKKLTLSPNSITQADINAILEQKWTEDALHHIIVITARMNFMIRIIGGFGFKPLTPKAAKKRAFERVEKATLSFIQI